MLLKDERVSLTQYRPLGQSGLRISPLGLGTLTFGTHTEFGADEAVCRTLFRHYVEHGGNFIDTANRYQAGQSEILVGRFAKEMGIRRQLVLSTKAGFTVNPSDANGGGNGRKHLYDELHQSLKRLQTDYVDIYWLHIWDCQTPLEEPLHALTEMVREGKIRYVGLSNVPAWYAARYQTLAHVMGMAPAIGLQLQYSLIERSIELEYVSAAQALGMGICPWSPLGDGFLSGKYTSNEDGVTGGGRLAALDTPQIQRITAPKKHWEILSCVKRISSRLGATPSQIAIKWASSQKGIGAPIIGSTTLAQLQQNVDALNVHIPKDEMVLLNQVSAPCLPSPYHLFPCKGNHTVNMYDQYPD